MESYLSDSSLSEPNGDWREDKGETTPAVEEKEIDFDDVIDQLRPFGPFQWKYNILGSLFEIPSSAALFFFMFGSAHPGWDCYVYAENSTNTSNNMILTNWQPSDTEVCTSNFTGCDRLIYNDQFTSIITEWDLVCSKNYIPALITTCLLVGVGVGSTLAGQLADSFGRRHVLIALATLQMCSIASQSLAGSWQVYAAIRFMTGVLLGGTCVVEYVFRLEVVGRDWRSLCTVLGAWNWGNILLATLAYFIRDWRHLSLAIGIVCLPVNLSWFFLQESPRWLIQQNRMDEASRVVRIMAKFNNVPAPDDRILEDIRQGNSSSENLSYHDLFRTVELTKRSVIVLCLWFVAATTMFGVTFNMRDISRNIYLNVLIMAVLDMAFHLSILYFSKCLGHKKAVIVYMTLASVTMMTVIGCDMHLGLKVIEDLRLGVALIGRAATSAAWLMGYLLAVELFPTLIRTLACAACSLMARVGGVAAAMIAYTYNYHPAIPYTVFTIFTLICSVMLLQLPETKGRPLPDALPPKTGICCFKMKTEVTEAEEEPCEKHSVITADGTEC